MVSRSLIAIALAISLGSLATGCGGGDGDSSTTVTSDWGAPIGKPEFVAQVNRICKRGRRALLVKVVQYQKKHVNEVSPKVVSGAARVVIKPGLESQIDQIEAVGLPKGGTGEIERFFAALRHGASEIADKKPLTFNIAEGMLQEAGAIARKYGIGSCNYVLFDKALVERVLYSG